MRRTHPLWILLCAWLVYLNSLGNGFHYDDSHSIVENPQLRSLGNIPRFFIDPGLFSREPAMAMYRPALLTTFALNYAAGGYAVWGYHLVNILLHSLAALLVCRIVGGLTGRQGAGWWAGMFFAVHPIHAQAVNYLSSRSEVLSALGVLAAFHLMSRQRRVWALAAHALALLSKETGVVLAPLLALYEWLKPAARREWKAHLPLWALTLAYVGVLSLSGFLPRSLAQEVRPLGEQLCTQLKALVYYLQLIAMPVRLSAEHAFAASRSLGDWPVLCSLLLAGSLLWCAWQRPQSPGSQGLCWFLAGLGLTFVIPLNVLVSEHRLYLPLVGALLVLPLDRRRWRWPGALALCLLAALTWQRNRVWQDEFTLWQDAASKAPKMFRAQSNWGMALYERGRVEEALQAFEQSLRLNPRYSKTWSNLGLVYEELGQEDEAEQAYLRALALRPDLAGACNNLGHLKLQQGDFAQAEAHLRKALELDPRYAQAQVNLGLLFHRRGQLDEARQRYEAALRLDPGDAEALNNLGLLHLDQGRPTEARAALQQALQARPAYQEARFNLELLELRQAGVPLEEAYAQLAQRFPERAELWLALGRARAAAGDWEGAIRAAQQALRLRPQERGGHLLLAGAHHSLGRFPEAVEAYERAIAQSPTDPDLYNNLAAALAAAGRIQEAVRATRRALELDPENARAAENLRQLRRARPGE